MSERGVILVTGATGHVGRHVVAGLRTSGARIRAMTRDPAAAGLPDGVDVVAGDLSDPAAFERRLDGVDAVFLLWPFMTSDGARAIVDVIAKHARRIVFLSSMSVPEAADQQTNPIFHAEIERLVEKSGLEWTFLRAGGFATNALGWAEQIRGEGVVRWPYAAAGRSLIHERDIADVAARVLTSDGHAGARYVLTGPQVLTQAEQAEIIGAAIGRPVRYEELTAETARHQMLAEGWPPAFADGALDYWATLVTRPEPVTFTVEEITGAPARTFREWAFDHADDFRPLPTENAEAGGEMSTEAVAAEYVSLCRQGQFDEAMRRLPSPEIVRVEPLDGTGTPVEMHGIEAVRNNSRGFAETSDIHGFEVDGPFVGQDRFAVRFAIDATFKPTGQRTTITKLELFTVKNGKLVRNEVYYNTPPPAEG